MAIDPLGAGIAVPPTARAANSLASAPLDEARQVAGHLAAGAEANPQVAQSQVQAGLRSIQSRADAEVGQPSTRRPDRGQIVDIEV